MQESTKRLGATGPKIGDTFLGPTKYSVTKCPDPELSWHPDMEHATGVEGVVIELDPNNPYLIRLNFPSLNCSWWYTLGALTLGDSVPNCTPNYHPITIEGQSYWITTPALENLKCELGILGPVAPNA